MTEHEDFMLPDDAPDPEDLLRVGDEILRNQEATRQEAEAGEEVGTCANCCRSLDVGDLDAEMFCVGCALLMCSDCGMAAIERNQRENADGDCEPILCDACRGRGADLVHPPKIEF